MTKSVITVYYRVWRFDRDPGRKYPIAPLCCDIHTFFIFLIYSCAFKFCLQWWNFLHGGRAKNSTKSWNDIALGFPFLPTHQSLPSKTSLTYVNKSKLLVACYIYSVVVITNNRLNRVARWMVVGRIQTTTIGEVCLFERDTKVVDSRSYMPPLR